MAAMSCKAWLSSQPAGRRQPRAGHAILARFALMRPDLVAFFACLYYAALRPEEAVGVRQKPSHPPCAGAGPSLSPALARAPPPGPALAGRMSRAGSNTAHRVCKRSLVRLPLA